MPVLRIAVLGFVTTLFALFAWGFWHQEVVTAQRVNTEFVEGTCVALGSAVAKQESGSDRSTKGRSVLGYSAHVNIRYTVDGNVYETGTLDGAGGYYPTMEEAFAEVAPFVNGESYPCWYDPADPTRVVLIRRDSYAGNYVPFVLLSILAAGSGSWLLVSVFSGFRVLLLGPELVDLADRLPRCQKCNAPLKSAQALQCFECGHDWH